MFATLYVIVGGALCCLIGGLHMAVLTDGRNGEHSADNRADHPDFTVIDDFRGACAVKGNGAVAGHVKRVDHDDVFDALLFREETLTRHYFILKFDFSWGIRTNIGKT